VQIVHDDHPVEIGEPKKPLQMRLQHMRTNERDWKRDVVVVVVIVGNEEDRKGEQRVVAEFHPVICVVHDPFTVIASKYSFFVNQRTMSRTPPVR
jgi:hypothetical protein